MRKVVYILLALISFGISDSYAINSPSYVNQVVKPNDDIKTMFDNEQYQEIISRYAGTPRTLSASQLTYVAQSYFQLSDQANAGKYIDMAIQKDTKYARAYYIRGIINNATGRYHEALADLQRAIVLAPKQSEYYTELGDAYLAQDNFGDALINYRKAVKLPQPSEKAYYMIGVVYAGMDDANKALDTFYVAKSKIVKDKELYVTLLYNIGKMEYDKKDYKKAIGTYQELIEFIPDDYYSIEKVVQCCNALEDYNLAEEMGQKLYTAYEGGFLASSSMSDMFCVDHFVAGGKEVAAYERFEEPSCRNFIKNIFYVAGHNGNIESTVFLEYILPAEEGGKGRYRLIQDKDSKRYTFSTLFDEGIRYGTLKPYIMDIVSGKLEATLLSDSE